MSFIQHKKYFLIKIIYTIIMISTIIVTFTFSVIRAEPFTGLDESLNYERAYADLAHISSETHAVGTVGHDHLEEWLEEKLKTITGADFCPNDFAECKIDHSEDIVLHKQTSQNNIFTYVHAKGGDYDYVFTYVGPGKGSLNADRIYVGENMGDYDNILSAVTPGEGIYDKDGKEMRTGDYDLLLTNVGAGKGTFDEDGTFMGPGMGSFDYVYVNVGAGKGLYVYEAVAGIKSTNFIVTIRGTDPNEKALMITTHYDGQENYDDNGNEILTPATSDAGIPLASLLEVMRYATENPVKNDVIFMISDAEEEGMIGATKFVEAMAERGENISERIGLVANFEARGNSGSLLMFETGKYESDTVKAFSDILGTTYSNSLLTKVYGMMENYTDLTVYKEQDMIGINFANVGGVETYHQITDNLENMSEGLFKQNMNTVLSVYKHFGNLKFNEIGESKQMIYFNFYTWGLVLLPVWAIYLFVGIMLIGLVLSAVLNRKNITKNNVLKVLKAAGIIFSSMLIAVGVTYIIALSPNPTFLVSFGALLLAVIIMTVAQFFLAKWFSVTKQEAILANTILLFVITALLTFIMPEASFVFLFPALINVLSVVLQSTIKNVNAKTIITDLNLPAWSSVFAFTTTVTFAILISYAMGTVYIPVVMLLPMLALGHFPLVLQDIKLRKNTKPLETNL